MNLHTATATAATSVRQPAPADLEMLTPAGNPIKSGMTYLFSDLNGEVHNIWVEVTRLDMDKGLAHILLLNPKEGEKATTIAVPDELDGPLATPAQIRQQARDLFHADGELEIDEDARITIGEDQTAYVACWVWVPNDATDLTAEDELDESARTQAYLMATNNITTAAEFDDSATVSLGDDAGAYVSGKVSLGAHPHNDKPLDTDALLARAPSYKNTLVTLNVPEFFNDEGFLAWLNDPDNRAFTWHQKGQPASEWSDVIVTMEATCNGEGDASDMPAHLWDALVAYAKENLGEASAGQYSFRLTNLFT